jgi:hypothetical protein
MEGEKDEDGRGCYRVSQVILSASRMGCRQANVTKRTRTRTHTTRAR